MFDTQSGVFSDYPIISDKGMEIFLKYTFIF